MKKNLILIVLTSVIFVKNVFSDTSNTNNDPFSSPSTAFSNFLDSAFSAPPKPALSTNAPAPQELADQEMEIFPLPEGMIAPPPLLSASITSAITATIASFITPALMKNIIAQPKMYSPTPTSEPSIGSFQPVGPPTNTSNFGAVTTSNGPTATSLTSNKQQVQSNSQPLMIKPLKPKSLTGNFDITSRYVFRGISQSANNLAFQGGLTYTFLTTGIYFNLWGSNVDFLSRQGQQASVQVNTIAGIKNTIGNNFIYNVSMVRYNYPKASGANYNELVSYLTYRIFTVTLGYSSNAFNAHANGLYYNGAFDIPIPEKYAFQYTNVSLMGNYGHYNLSKDVGLRSYSDFMLGIKKSIKSYTLMLQWIGTNGEAKLKGLDANRLVGTVAVNF